MKIIRTLILLVGLTAGGTAHSEVLYLFCDDPVAPESCGPKANVAIEKIGCEVDSSKTVCRHSLEEDPNNPNGTVESNFSYCEVTSANCTQPRTGNFGGEWCDTNQDMKKMAKLDRVNNGYWMGIFGSMSRKICINK